MPDTDLEGRLAHELRSANELSPRWEQLDHISVTRTVAKSPHRRASALAVAAVALVAPPPPRPVSSSRANPLTRPRATCSGSPATSASLP
jgi:hypothetical protein